MAFSSPQEGGCHGIEFSLASLTKEAPHLFYLPNSDMVDLADATIAVAGSQLPVHSQCLAAASAVLCEVFRGEAEHRVAKRVCLGSTVAATCRHAAPARCGAQSECLCHGTAGMPARARTELATPWSDYTLEEVTLFLRFTYSPQDCTPANLHKSAAHLPRLLQLAHQLGASRMGTRSCSTVLMPPPASTCWCASAMQPMRVSWMAPSRNACARWGGS